MTVQDREINKISDPEPQTLEACIAWLDARYRRHGELEDKSSADFLREFRTYNNKDHRHDLIRAAALIVAEIERLDRSVSTRKAQL